MLALNMQQHSGYCYEASQPQPAPCSAWPLQPPGSALCRAAAGAARQCPCKERYCGHCSHRLRDCSADGVMVSLRIQPSNSNDTAGLSCLMGSFPLYYNCDFQLNNSRVFLDPLRLGKKKKVLNLQCWLFFVCLFILLCFLFPLN